MDNNQNGITSNVASPNAVNESEQVQVSEEQLQRTYKEYGYA